MPDKKKQKNAFMSWIDKLIFHKKSKKSKKYSCNDEILTKLNKTVATKQAKNLFIYAATYNDINKLNDAFQILPGKMRDDILLKILRISISKNHLQIIENIPINIFRDIDPLVISALCKETPREKENETFKFILDSAYKHSEEFKSEKIFEILKDFRKGDMFYGMGVPRNEVIRNLFEEFDFTADSINDLIMQTRTIDCEYLGSKFTKNNEAIIHADYLENHPRYDPRKVSPIDDKHNFNKNSRYDKDNVRDTRIKRSCKAGITRILEGDRDIKLHFILNDFDPLEALNKLDEKNEIKFTNSELRLIYRKWLENPSLVDNKIIFWDENFNKIKVTDFFNSLKNKFCYIPKSQKNNALLKLHEWHKKESNTLERKQNSTKNIRGEMKF